MPSAERKQVVIVLSAILAAAFLSLALPDMALNTVFADAVVRVTDTASWPQLAILGAGVAGVVITRPGIGRRRRVFEAGAFALVLLLFLAGNAALNEYVVKPYFAVPRPNIEELADSGALGTDFPDADAFYTIGNKAARRRPLGQILASLESPLLSDRVRAHWAHETGYSFPSGHSTAAMTLAAMMVATGLVWLDGWRRVLTVVVLPLWAVAVVYSRVLLDVHTAGDVIVGALAGIWWGLLAFAAVRWGVSRR